MFGVGSWVFSGVCLEVNSTGDGTAVLMVSQRHHH